MYLDEIPEEVDDGFELTEDELDEQREKVNTMEKVEPSNVDIKIESRKVEGGDTVKTDTELVYPEKGELYELAKQDTPEFSDDVKGKTLKIDE